eukprot:403348042
MEMQKYQNKLSPIQTLYFGGGTPSLLTPIQLQSVINQIQKHQKFDKNPEITLEIDPGTFDSQKLNDFHSLGVNRLSMGIQTFNEEEFQLLGRGHNFNEIDRSINEVLKSNFKQEQVSIDQIIGIPKQTKQSQFESLKQSVKFGFHHQSFYMLTLEQNTPFMKKYQYDSKPLPVTDDVTDMYLQTHDFLESQGFIHYELSNYSKSLTNQSRHNNMYWEGDQEYLAFGVGAASYIKNKRFSRPKTLTRYYKFVNYFGTLNSQDFQEKYKAEADSSYDIIQTIIMCQLRKKSGLQYDKLSNYIPNYEEIQNLIIRDIKLKYKEQTELYFSNLNKIDGISLTPQGWLVSNQIISDIQLMFDQYLLRNQN